MSRHAAQRSLTLTEELERIEQQITLTLQEIDSNFSKAHRIVTSSILPIVEEYAKHSNDVWESSKYWKQFFESAANVSLSGYEEAALEEEEDTTTDEHTATHLTTPDRHGQVDAADASDDDFTIDSPTQISGVQSTPKLGSSGSRTVRGKPGMRSPSPRKYTGKNPLGDDGPLTPNGEDSQFSSPFQQGSASRKAGDNKKRDNVDPVLHRSVLDKNYRVLSTPFKQYAQAQQAANKTTTSAVANKAAWDDSPDSSPEMAAPQLRSELFSPPKQTAARLGPRTPGVSVQKPAKNNEGAPVTSTGRKLFSKEDKAMSTNEQRPTYNFSRFDSDEEDDDSLGISPPKTLQFHVPQSRLLQTPAKEASKKIVEDLLATAGMADSTTSELDLLEEASPSVVRGRYNEDDTF
ncbi:hypothetical protein AMS68_006283 [Peltaster fructicola]|uniref:DASH complex subunit ASK1 n=1 Tax=Peltaster fructicola TaxID=286661 RepID=A0A6H0Y1E5_9PEZI|nr:hypothetical protein AMS68_006283 [Peltaster fructicola]